MRTGVTFADVTRAADQLLAEGCWRALKINQQIGVLLTEN